MATEPSANRNPPWSRDELILALDLYMHDRASPPGKHSREVAALSELLNRMGRLLRGGLQVTYRNPNGVYMKMMNFRRFDPAYTEDGRVGLTRGNKEEEGVWKEFAADSARLKAVARAIRDQVETDQVLESAPEVTEAIEGRILTRLHRVRERDRRIVEQRKATALKEKGGLACEVCGFDFEASYGEHGRGFIEAHHTKPLHELPEDTRTRLEDLALVCANCHRMIHATRRWLTVDELRALLTTASDGRQEVRGTAVTNLR